MPDAESSLIGIRVDAVEESLRDRLAAPAAGAPPAEEAVEPAPAPPAEAPEPPAPEPEGVVSATLAEVHVQQGLLDEARAMYRKLLEREPDNDAARARLAQLEGAAAGADAEAPPEPASAAPEPAATAPSPPPWSRREVVTRQIAALERMLAGVRRR